MSFKNTKLPASTLTDKVLGMEPTREFDAKLSDAKYTGLPSASVPVTEGMVPDRPAACRSSEVRIPENSVVGRLVPETNVLPDMSKLISLASVATFRSAAPVNVLRATLSVVKFGASKLLKVASAEAD